MRITYEQLIEGMRKRLADRGDLASIRSLDSNVKVLGKKRQTFWQEQTGANKQN